MRVGLVLNILDEEYQISVYKGIIKKAAELGVEIICIQQESDYITNDDLISHFQKKEYFDLDGIILLTSVINDCFVFKTKEDIQKVWGDLPVVSIGQKVEGVPSVLIQTDESMKQLVEHLILKHNYRKFLFISGAKNHPDAMVREQIFEKSMQAYKPWFPDLSYKIKEGWFTERAAIDAMTEYVSESENQIPDVVVCANDNMAIGVYKFFKISRKDPNVHECAVTGFDDIPQAKFEIPSLTTVHQPLLEIGEKAVDIIKEMIKGKKVDNEFYIESRVMYRKSCGCSNCEDDFSTNEDLVREMQTSYVRSENLLRMVSHIGQSLNYIQGIGGLKYVVRENLDQLDLKNFCILRFYKINGRSVTKSSKNIYVDPLYIRRNGQEIYSFDKDMKIPFGVFYKKYLELEEGAKPSLIFKYLRAGDELIGCVIYDANDSVLPYLSSIAINIAQSLNRIDTFEERKKHSEYLEQEVNERTKELVEANNKRMEVEAEVLRISEIERQRFSNDLHDDICQRLAGISMLCRSYSNQEKPVEKTQMVELAELIGETLQTTRQYAHNSYPVELESLGINHSLSNLCNSFSASSGINCNYVWNVKKGIHFDKTQKLNIFRIIQEALHNVAKHAKANNVDVNVVSEDNKVLVQVIDDGCGFKVGTPSSASATGLGLNSMQYRANQIGAKFTVKQNKPKGTCVQVSIKIEKGQTENE